MRNNVTARLERLVLALREMSQEIEPELHAVSHVACQEWRALQGTWPSDSQLREGTTGLTEEQVEAIVAKTRRFKDIVHDLASSRSRPRLRDDDSSPSERSSSRFDGPANCAALQDSTGRLENSVAGDLPS